MRNISNERFVASKVLIEFEDGQMSFRIPRGATLADVSEKLAKIVRWQIGQPLFIDVRFTAANGKGYASAYPSSLISQAVEALYRVSSPAACIVD